MGSDKPLRTVGGQGSRVEFSLGNMLKKTGKQLKLREMWGKGLTSSHDTWESANVPFHPVGTGRRVDGTNGLRRKRRFEEDVEFLEKDQAQSLIENSVSMRKISSSEQ